MWFAQVSLIAGRGGGVLVRWNRWKAGPSYLGASTATLNEMVWKPGQAIWVPVQQHWMKRFESRAKLSGCQYSNTEWNGLKAGPSYLGASTATLNETVWKPGQAIWVPVQQHWMKRFESRAKLSGCQYSNTEWNGLKAGPSHLGASTATLNETVWKPGQAIWVPVQQHWMKRFESRAKLSGCQYSNTEWNGLKAGPSYLGASTATLNETVWKPGQAIWVPVQQHWMKRFESRAKLSGCQYSNTEWNGLKAGPSYLGASTATLNETVWKPGQAIWVPVRQHWMKRVEHWKPSDLSPPSAASQHDKTMGHRRQKERHWKTFNEGSAVNSVLGHDLQYSCDYHTHTQAPDWPLTMMKYEKSVQWHFCPIEWLETLLTYSCQRKH